MNREDFKLREKHERADNAVFQEELLYRFWEAVMGLEASSLKGLESNEYLERLCGQEALSPFDPIWNKLFSHSIKPVLSREDDFLLDTTLEKLRSNLVNNNIKTKNVVSLIEVFASRAKELQISVQTADNIFIWQAYNAICIIRSILKHFYSNLTEEECARQLEKSEQKFMGNGNTFSIPEASDPMELLLETLVQILIELPITDITYILHLETINTLIVILSQQMFTTTKSALKLPSYRFLMQGGIVTSSVLLTQKLLSNYIEQRIPPYPVWNNNNSGSIVIGFASGIWNILRKGIGLSPYSDEIMEGLKIHNLAKQSLYLLLILVNHCTGRGEPPENYVNPYRLSIIACANDTGSSADDDEFLLPEARVPTFKINFSKLYTTICEQINTDETTLLLYLLTFENVEFMSYIMARSDIETLVLPMIHTLYNAPMSSTHHIYMSLIILLILSEEELFNHQIHDITLKNIYWYTERTVGEITLGGLIILVIIRTIQYNILKMRDKYLHTNCLASLANMSSKFRSLHPYVAQRLISLFETLGKRYLKLLQRVENMSSEQEEGSEVGQDIAVLEEVVRMVLEILNSTLSHQLSQNRHLVYTLLYKKDTLQPFRSQDATQDLVANLDTVINYFSRRIGTDYPNHSASQVMEQIEDGVLHWKPDILKKFPELKFRYVEEPSPEAFFVPYVWSLIFQRSGIHWTNVSMELFNLEPETFT